MTRTIPAALLGGVPAKLASEAGALGGMQLKFAVEIADGRASAMVALSIAIFSWGGTFRDRHRFETGTEECKMNSVIYLIGLVVVVLAILSFLGLN
jgi:hypothetical protein